MKRMSMAVVAATVLLVAGCGESDEEQAVAPAAAETSACDLPADYVSEHPWVRNIPC
jgi:nitrous oxide reductase accessory protein NosL